MILPHPPSNRARPRHREARFWTPAIVRRSSLGALLVVGVIFGAGCRPESPDGATAIPPLPAREVTVATARKGRHPMVENVTGTVRSRLRAAIEAKVSGRLKQLAVAPGQKVVAGTLLAEVDVAEVAARAAQARATAEQAEREQKRLRTLLAQEAVTQAEFDAAESRARVARAAAEEAEVMVGYARVVAPFDGVVTRKLADEGTLVGPGRPILEMENPSALRFEADVPVSLLDRIHLGDQREVYVATLDAALAGTVSELDPMADPASRTARVRLDLPADARLRTGLFGRVTVPVGESTQVSVPASAIVRRGQLELAWVVAEGRARLRMVRTGRLYGGDQEVLAGLEEGERVVVSPEPALVDGQPVKLP